MPTAILVDGGYFVKRFRSIEPHNRFNSRRAAECMRRWALAHLVSRGAGQKKRELYRIFFYDCPPLMKKMHNPITKNAIDFGKSQEAKFRMELHDALKKHRKTALRLGHLSSDVQWAIKPAKIKDLLTGRLKLEELTGDDVMLDIRQKGVDMRIGVDVSSLVFKRQVDQIVLIAGDAAFVPAAKQARREGIDFVLDPMWRPIPPGLEEHIDGLRSTCPKARRPPVVQEPVGRAQGPT